jgi:hypothetical protein
MSQLWPLLQYIPLTLFLFLSRQSAFGASNWSIAFQVSGLLGAVELALILYFTKNRFHRLVSAATLFLIIGGLAFYFEIEAILNTLSTLRESTLLLMMTLVCTIATLTTKTGAFEQQWADEKIQKKYSFYFILCTIVALVWSYAQRGNSNAAGFAPVVVLILTKIVFQKTLAAKQSSGHVS